MKGSRFHLILALALVPLLSTAQNPASQTDSSPGQESTAPSTRQPGSSMASNGAIKILSPKVDEKIGSSIVTVQFQLVNTALSADSTPSYRIRLDSRDPIETTSTEQSFTGLEPGDHVLSIDLVDANHNPIPHSHIDVRFQTFTPGPNPNHQTGALHAPTVVKASMRLPTAEELPYASGELPLLSIIGFGVLLGGVISAMRTRR